MGPVTGQQASTQSRNRDASAGRICPAMASTCFREGL